MDYLALVVNSAVNIDFNGFVVPLLAYTFLIAIYGVFVWAFYKSVSKRDLFRLEYKDHKRRLRIRIFFFLKYVVLFPILTFLWFSALTIILFFLSKSQTTGNILLISMGLVAATRITSYYKEELSQEIAKILPLAVLGIFVVDPSFFSFDVAFSRFYEVPSLVPLLIDYLIVIVIMELVYRIILHIKRHISSRRKARKEQKQKTKKVKIKGNAKKITQTSDLPDET